MAPTSPKRRLPLKRDSWEVDFGRPEPVKGAEPQLVAILRGAEAGVLVADLLRRHEISRTAFYLWKSRTVA